MRGAAGVKDVVPDQHNNNDLKIDFTFRLPEQRLRNVNSKANWKIAEKLGY